MLCRLGCLKEGVGDILSHPWFTGIELPAVLEGCAIAVHELLASPELVTAHERGGPNQVNYAWRVCYGGG